MARTASISKEALPHKSQLRILSVSSRYSRLLLSPSLSSSPSPTSPPTPDWQSWCIPSEGCDSVCEPDSTLADPIPAEFEPVTTPKSFNIPVDASGKPKDANDVFEAEIYSPFDSPAVRELKQEEFWEWEQECTLRTRRWRERFGNPHTPLGQLQTALKFSIKAGEEEMMHGELPEWTEDSWLAQLIVFYPPVLERLVKFLDLQALLGLMSTSVFLRRLLLLYPPAWRHISFAVRKGGFRKEREVAIKEDALWHGSKYGAWTGSKLRFTSGALRLDCASGSKSFGTEARILSSLPLAGLRILNLDGSPAAGGRAFYDVLRTTRSTLEVLSVRFCKFVGVADVEKFLVSCAVKGVEDAEEVDKDEDEEEEEEETDNATGHRFAKDSNCALTKLRIWGIEGKDSTSPKSALPTELSRTYIGKTRFGKAIDVDQRRSFVNGMFYIPHSISKKATGSWGSDPASQDITGRILVIARQLGIETDFEDCDINDNCWNHRHISRTSNEWKVGIPGLKTVRKCSGCGLKKKGTMCRDCEEHRTCFGCKKFICSDCDPNFSFADNQCDPCADEGRLYCEDCHDATAEAMSELAAVKCEYNECTQTESCPARLGWHGGRSLDVISSSFLALLDCSSCQRRECNDHFALGGWCNGCQKGFCGTCARLAEPCKACDNFLCDSCSENQNCGCIFRPIVAFGGREIVDYFSEASESDSDYDLESPRSLSPLPYNQSSYDTEPDKLISPTSSLFC